MLHFRLETKQLAPDEWSGTNLRYWVVGTHHIGMPKDRAASAKKDTLNPRVMRGTVVMLNFD